VTLQTADKLVTVFGGSGFIGRHIVRSLAKRGYRVRVACRRPDLAVDVLPYGVPGQIALVQANVRFPQSVEAACAGAYAVVNATGTPVSSGNQTFEGVVAAGSDAIARAAKAAGASLCLMISGIIMPQTLETSEAVKAKAQAEAATQKAFPGAMVLRPSVVFGPDDTFFNKMAALARFSPVMPVFGDGSVKYQPVFVGDVAEACATLIDAGQAIGKTYELGGPETVSMEDLTKFTLETVVRKRLIVKLPWGISKLLAAVAGNMPGKPLTMDQLEILKVDNVVSDKAKSEKRTLEGLGISPRSFRTVTPSYLYRFRKEGQFTVPSGTPQ
jgi:uncharacterized protein YbjT (DUF2867 family)